MTPKCHMEDGLMIGLLEQMMFKGTNAVYARGGPPDIDLMINNEINRYLTGPNHVIAWNSELLDIKVKSFRLNPVKCCPAGLLFYVTLHIDFLLPFLHFCKVSQAF